MNKEWSESKINSHLVRYKTERDLEHFKAIAISNDREITELNRLLEQARSIAAGLEAELHDLRGTE